MNIVSNQSTDAYYDFGYPIGITGTSDGIRPHRETQAHFFDNGRFSKGFRFGRNLFYWEPEPISYNAEKKMEPNKMRLIGTMIDVYA